MDTVSQSLRIGLVTAARSVVPPERSGTIEWLVSLLAEGLIEQGHHVALFAGPGSITTGELVSVVDPHEPPGPDDDLEHVLEAWLAAERLDLVNDHSGLLAAGLADLCPVPVCHTVHEPLDGRLGHLYRLACRLNPRLRLLSVSLGQRAPAPDLPWLGTCPNALDLDAYPYAATRGEHLVFIGRMTEDKGAHRAIAVAQRLGVPLRICGRMHGEAERAYFARAVAPHLGPMVEYLGEVAHEEKVRLLRTARCTLFPSTREEPFGLVLLESMACGTPVIGLRHGAVPEVIAHGVTGYVVDDVEQMAAAVLAADDLDPAACRAHVEETFSERRMIRSYLAAYAELLAAHPDA